jgi:hypothetical protein
MGGWGWGLLLLSSVQASGWAGGWGDGGDGVLLSSVQARGEWDGFQHCLLHDSIPLFFAFGLNPRSIDILGHLCQISPTNPPPLIVMFSKQIGHPFTPPLLTDMSVQESYHPREAMRWGYQLILKFPQQVVIGWVVVAVFCP